MDDKPVVIKEHSRKFCAKRHVGGTATPISRQSIADRDDQNSDKTSDTDGADGDRDRDRLSDEDEMDDQIGSGQPLVDHDLEDKKDIEELVDKFTRINGFTIDELLVLETAYQNAKKERDLLNAGLKACGRDPLPDVQPPPRMTPIKPSKSASVKIPNSTQECVTKSRQRQTLHDEIH